MKKIILYSALLATGIATAATPIDGWYGSAFGGYAYLPSFLHKWHKGFFLTDDRYENNFDAGLSFGFKSTPLRYEGELTYIQARLKSFNANGFKHKHAHGFNRTGLAMANIYYDFPAIVPTIEPFLGIGIGYSHITGSFNSRHPLFRTHYDTSNNVFAYQAIAGLTYNFAETWALNVGYRYIATNHANNFGRSFQANLANLGLVYRFDGNIYK